MLDFFATVVWIVDRASAARPGTRLKEALKFGKSKAVIGLRQAANETIEVIGKLEERGKSHC